LPAGGQLHGVEFVTLFGVNGLQVWLEWLLQHLSRVYPSLVCKKTFCVSNKKFAGKAGIG